MNTDQSNVYWNRKRHSAGQVVEIYHPQLSGAAEGERGPAPAMRLRYDRSDLTWTLTHGCREISGQGEKPSVTEAINLITSEVSL